MPSRLRILGIDPGSRVVGFACLEAKVAAPTMPRDFRVVEAGVLKPDLTLSFTRRLGRIHGGFHTIIGEMNPSVCVIESAFAGVNANSALKLGQARGAIIAAADRHSVDVHEVTPAAVKKQVAGNGQASKEEISQALMQLMQFDRGKLPFDVTDALAIALYFGISGASKSTPLPLADAASRTRTR